MKISFLLFALAAALIALNAARQLSPAADRTLVYDFGAFEAFDEAPAPGDSANPYWWLDSGARLQSASSTGNTIRGALPEGDRWRAAYARTNSLDTDAGRHPQNLFRLLSRASWYSPRIEASVAVLDDNLSASPNRNESNGLFLMSRYRDADNLYYAGIRVDGRAVIKKKRDGAYETLAEIPLFPGEYDRVRHADLIPKETWLTLLSETTTLEDGAARIRLFVGQGEGSPAPVLEATDADDPITGSGSVGIRTDFMDVQFKTVRVTELH